MDKPLEKKTSEMVRSLVNQLRDPKVSRGTVACAADVLARMADYMDEMGDIRIMLNREMGK
jgi:hypothetical protein